MIANRTPKNIGATSANSTTAEPPRLRRKRRRIFLAGAAGEDIEQTSGRGSNYRKELPETDCRSVSPDADKAPRCVKQSLTMSEDGEPCRAVALRRAAFDRIDEGSSVAGFRSGSRRARSLAGERAGLVDRRLEIVLAVAERDPTLA